MDHLEFAIATPDCCLTALTFCPTNTASVGSWSRELPLANTVETARLLQQAAREIGRLETDAATRIGCLEAIRPALFTICERLDKRAGEGGALDDHAAIAAQQLQLDLITGYKAAVRDCLREPLNEAGMKRFGMAVHRALAGTARVLLRACQFYTALPRETWRDLNQLYLLSEELGLTTASYQDAENRLETETTVASAYLRSLLIATARPNQLRQRQLKQIFDALELWVSSATLSCDTTDATFIVDLSADEPPHYCAIGFRPGDYIRGLHLDPLVRSLEAAADGQADALVVPNGLEPHLLQQLAHAWGEMKRRSFQRRPASGALKVCAGLRSMHYFISGGVEFVDQIDSTSALLRRELNPFLVKLQGGNPTEHQKIGRDQDPWLEAIDAGSPRIPENPNIEEPERVLLRQRSQTAPEVLAKRYPCFDTHIEDTSPAGYRLRWPHPFPSQILTGELLALREVHDVRWTIAICRWIRHTGKESRMGVELLAPRALPIAVRRVDKRGRTTDALRALLLPPLGAINQPATLVLPQLNFSSQQKLEIINRGAASTIQLLDCRQRTESFTQFTFRMLEGYLENTESGMNMDVLWQSMGTEPVRATR
jgi:cyclic-di-GMP-binding protein